MHQFCEQLDVEAAAGVLAQRAAASRDVGGLVKAAQWRDELWAYTEKRADFLQDLMKTTPGKPSSPTFVRDAGMEALRNALIGGGIGAGVGGVSELFSKRRKKRYLQRMLHGGLLGGAIGGGGTALFRGGQALAGPSKSQIEQTDSDLMNQLENWSRNKYHPDLKPQDSQAILEMYQRMYPDQDPAKLKQVVNKLMSTPQGTQAPKTSGPSVFKDPVGWFDNQFAVTDRAKNTETAFDAGGLPGVRQNWFPNMGAGGLAAAGTYGLQRLHRSGLTPHPLGPLSGETTRMRNWANENQSQFGSNMVRGKGVRNRFTRGGPASGLPAGGLRQLRSRVRQPKGRLGGLLPLGAFLMGSGWQYGR